MIRTIETLADVSTYKKQQLKMLLAMRYDTLRSMQEDRVALLEEISIIQQAMELQGEC